MNSIPNTSGVYILVFHQSRKTDISIDRKNTRHSFPPGWYLYVGSACGVGGLNRRLARHQNRIADSKRMHWNIDYFREHAMLCELWYCETGDSGVEHQWAETLTELVDATVPVPKFGASDCKARCQSHLFHLLDRPLTATFRAKLASRGLSTEVLVEFIMEPRRTKQSARGLRCEYLLGRRFLEIRRRSIAESGLESCQWASFAKHRPARTLAEQVAEQMKVPFSTLKPAIEFAMAVETLIENCGADVLPILFDPNRPQGRKAIMSLSRTSDIRQRYRVNVVIDGLFRSVAPHSDDTVFDTISFAEVRSRLKRARGSLEKVLAQLKTPHDSEIVEELKQLSRLCGMAAKLLDECLTNWGSPPPALPHDLCKESVMARVRSKAVRGLAIGKARQALRFTVKNVWDFEEMVRRGLEPTTHELQVTRSELKRISAPHSFGC